MPDLPALILELRLNPDARTRFIHPAAPSRILLPGAVPLRAALFGSARITSRGKP